MGQDGWKSQLGTERLVGFLYPVFVFVDASEMS